jgi:type I restriction enzyme, S subunit
MIPDGWKRKNLGEVITLQRGFDLPEQDRIHGTIPIISSSGITGFHNESKVSPPGIVTGRYGTIGKVFLVDVDFWPLNTSLWVKDFYGNDHRYIYYLLQSIDYKKLSDKTGVPGINRNDVHKLRVLLPPLLEQCRIGEMLGVWDESIDLLERLIGRVRSRKQGLMQQLLTGKKRFKEFEGSEWKEYQLSQIANITMGTSPKSESYNSKKEGLPLLQGNADIKNRVSAPRIWTTEITKECYPTDILISVRAPVGTIAISLHHACIGRGIASIKAKSEITSNYLYQLLLFHEPKWVGLSQGSTFDSVNSADIKSCLFSIPLIILEQEKIAAVLFAADEEISTLEKQLAAYKQQKLGLMQQLLTGRIRI